MPYSNISLVFFFYFLHIIWGKVYAKGLCTLIEGDGIEKEKKKIK